MPHRIRNEDFRNNIHIIYYIYFRIDYTGNSEIRTVTHNHGVVVLIIDLQIYCCTNKMYAVYRYNTADCNGTTNSTSRKAHEIVVINY